MVDLRGDAHRADSLAVARKVNARFRNSEISGKKN